MQTLAECTLLIVEDDREARTQLCEILRGEFREVYQACDGEDGLKRYKETAPDLILADINMPKMDGIEMAKTIKEINRMQPIVFLTARSDSDALFAANNVPADGYVYKPITDIDAMTQALHRAAMRLQQTREYVQQHLTQREAVYRETLAMHEARSLRDALTGIPNRHAFQIELDRMWEYAVQNAQPLSLMFIDLDNLKTINDRYGHQVGDVAIQAAGRAIQTPRKPEVMCARYGGDEFVRMYRGEADPQRLADDAAEILRVLGEPVEHDGKHFTIGCSIGISRFPEDTQTQAQLIYLADEAMYRAKRSGKNRWAFAVKP